MNLTRDQLLDWIRPQLGKGPVELADDTPLFSTGNLNSRRMLDLVVFLERSLGLRMKTADVRLDNLDSVARILAWAIRAEQARAPRS